MSYVLDGIRTAMVERERGSRLPVITHHIFLDCPCGAVLSPSAKDALRFHYAHCPHAHAPTSGHTGEKP